MRSRRSRRLPGGTKFLIGAFTLSGVVHLVKPDVFVSMIPPALGVANAWVIGSGVVELFCAFALFRRFWWARHLTVVTLAAIWVGNWWMAYDLLNSDNRIALAVAIIRLPLQIPMMIWAWRSPSR